MRNFNDKSAVIDIGSNTIRLVIYHMNPFGKFKERENIKAPARLRQFLNADNLLEQTGIELLVEILTDFKDICDHHEVQDVKCVATATIRQALNKEEILEAIKQKTGFEITILSEIEEAFYGYFAVIHTTPTEEAVTIDIGGGSTEITYFKNRRLLYSHSFPFGVVSLKEDFIHGEQMTAEEKNKLQNYLIQCFQSLPWLKELQVPIVAIGGSARNLAQIEQNLNHYSLMGIHQYTITSTVLKDVRAFIEGLNLQQLQKLEGLSSERTDIIIPALEVFVQLSDYVQSDTLMFSRKGLRDGILLKEYEKRNEQINTVQIANESIKELENHYSINPIHSEHVARLAKKLSIQILSLSGMEKDAKIHVLIDYSARLYSIGQFVDQDVNSEHTFYLLANQSLDGLMHKDRLKVALIASYKNKTLLKEFAGPFEKWITSEELQEIRIAGAVIKLAASLDASKRGIVDDIHVKTSIEEDELIISINCKAPAFVEKIQVEKHRRHLEKVLKKTIKLIFTNT